MMEPRVKEVFRSAIADECESLAREGLRTLVFALRYIPKEEYAEWKVKYDAAAKQLVNRNAAIREAADLLEKGLDFLGISGVEDKLQDDVMTTVESMRNAGIKVWMLTGDKVETAKCIAISTGIKTINQRIFELRDSLDELQLRNKLIEFSQQRGDTVLLIDGVALARVIDSTNSTLFFETATKAPAVICCRCLPTQKALVVERVREFAKKRVAAIGDGGNDVGMIQSADVGIGIMGKEGNQAALASDFSIMEFQHLKKLILWHGRHAYKRSSILSQFVIHRGLVISIIQMFFICTFYYVAISVYNGALMLGYTTIFTSLPVFSLVQHPFQHGIT